jgi:hypothetical protein
LSVSKLPLKCAVVVRCTLNELKTAVTAYRRNISQADLQKVFANKIKWVQACSDGQDIQYKCKIIYHVRKSPWTSRRAEGEWEGQTSDGWME